MIINIRKRGHVRITDTDLWLYSPEGNMAIFPRPITFAVVGTPCHVSSHNDVILRT